MYAKTGARAQPQELVEQHGPLVGRIAHHLLALHRAEPKPSRPGAP